MREEILLTWSSSTYYYTTPVHENKRHVRTHLLLSAFAEQISALTWLEVSVFPTKESLWNLMLYHTPVIQGRFYSALPLTFQSVSKDWLAVRIPILSSKYNLFSILTQCHGHTIPSFAVCPGRLAEQCFWEYYGHDGLLTLLN